MSREFLSLAVLAAAFILALGTANDDGTPNSDSKFNVKLLGAPDEDSGLNFNR